MKTKYLFSTLLLLFTLVSFSCQRNKELYNLGTEIADSVATKLAGSFYLLDPDLTYKIKTSQDEFTFEKNNRPVIEASLIVNSNILNNPKITFDLLLEAEDSSGYTVGTIKNIKRDGFASSALDLMNNTKYIKTDMLTGQFQIIQVQISDGDWLTEDFEGLLQRVVKKF